MANDPQTIRTNYLNLPKQVKEWLSSETAAYLVGEINDRLGLDEEKSAVIPNLILRLVTQDLETTSFINEISEGLGLNWQAAKAIAEDVEKKVLKPIENDLRRETGIDLKLIYFGKPSAAKISPISPISPIGPLPSVSHPTEWEKLRKAETPPIPPAPTLPPPPLPTPPTPPAPPSPPEKKEIKEPKVNLESFEAPFLLHQESFYAPEQTSAKETAKAQPRLNIKVQNYAEAPKETPKPVPAKIELPAQISEMKAASQNLIANIQEQKARVVHYNEARTPLTAIGTPKTAPLPNQVDLRKFAKPKINTLDLRQKNN